MNELRINLDRYQTHFNPGEEISGTASWRLDKSPRTVELRLFWFTRGYGTGDVGVVETVPFERPISEESRPFRIRLPMQPYSFSGQLITLVWALELVVLPAKTVARVELVMAPGGQEVKLESLPEIAASSSPKKSLFRFIPGMK